jgi:hypothetical protein
VLRYAIVRNARDRDQAQTYLPDNYSVIWEGQVPRYEGSADTITGHVIQGRDVAGWTLDGYVIPRYASGLIWAEEIDLSHPVMKQVP